MINISEMKIAGRLGKDPEGRTTQNGKRVTTFSVAVNLGYGDNRTTVWYDVVTWEKQAEFAEQYLHKGDLVYVSGVFKPREYEDRNGNKRQAWELTAREVQGETMKQKDFERIDVDEGELPF